MCERKDLGDLGEKIAREYLKRKGYKILDKNFRYSKLGELDIIAEKPARHASQPRLQRELASGQVAGVAGRNDIVFIEVKTRNKTGPGGFWPEDNITYAKQKKLIKLSQIYLSKHRLFDSSWQIDILAVEVYRNGSYDIRHTENAVGDMY
ncbi:YraN family protein [Patescibacteria group bacterium]|nr:YraN family protein [Patescibacteria group bacterium]MBU4458426.1 YraN family protein [Patescibacteria group bacterium]MCG2696124.1 YraN family protein [Candidatus Portnoybacteria bacterium]